MTQSLESAWSSNFEMIKDLGNIKYQRAVVPDDAKNLDIVTIDTGDASSNLIGSAIYARFEHKDGSFSCQLVFARSRVLPEGISIPRAELMAADLNAATGYTVQKAFGTYHKRAIKLTDSMVTLHWISSQRNTLKTWVRTRVIEINRWCGASNWCYVATTDMVADLGTRKGAKVCDVDQDSKWINGLPWMSGPESEFPTLTIDEIRLNQHDVTAASKESIIVETFYSREAEFVGSADDKIRSRYQFSNYVIDPNRFRFRKVVRALALALTFIKRSSKTLKNVQESNANIFRAWFKAWIISCVPLLMERPKWHRTDQEMCIGDIVLFLKSEREFDEQYQYGKVCDVHRSRDGNVRRVDVEYRNRNEGANRVTHRGVRDLVVVYPVDELDIYERLDKLID